MTRLWCWLFGHRWLDRTVRGYAWFPPGVRYCRRCKVLEIYGERQ